MKVIHFEDMKKDNSNYKMKKKTDIKSHAELLREAFIALEKYDIPQVYKV